MKRSEVSPLFLITFFLLLSLTGLALSTILLGSVPPVDRDALTHHLFVPKLWLNHGGIYEIPEIPFSYYPMNLDLLYAIPLFFGNDIIPKYIHYCFALLTALLIYRYLKRQLGVHYGLLGALFFLSIPIIVKLSITVYVDLGLVFFTTAALFLLLQWAEDNFSWHLLILSGLCCGLAAGTKYNGLIAIVALTLLVPIVYQRNASTEQRSNFKALLFGFAFAMAVFTAFSPWLIRNYLWTGNPIYPLHNSLFQKLRSPDTSQQTVEPAATANTLKQRPSQGSGAFASRKTLYNESGWQILLLPIRFFFEGQDDNPQYFDGKLSPFLLLLPCLAFLFRPQDNRRRREQNILLAFTLLYFFFTFFQEVLRIRYIAPIVPTLAVLSIQGIHGMLSTISPGGPSSIIRKSTFLFIAACIPGLMLWYNGQYIANQFAVVNPTPYLLGKISRDDYITGYRPEYPAIRHANALLPPDAKVLCIFMGNRGYHMDFQPVFEQPYGTGLFSNFLATENHEKKIFDMLRQKNITHVLMRDDLTYSWFQNLNDQNKQSIAPLLQNAAHPLINLHGHTFFSATQTTGH